METLKNKIDFAVIFTVENANPNGDPLDGNRPRVTLDDLGEVSDVCLKRKIRDRLQDAGTEIFVQSDGKKKTDGAKTLKDRYQNKIKSSDPEEIAAVSNKTWFDVRAFGQVFAYGSGKKNGKKKGKKTAVAESDDASEGKAAGKSDSVSVGIRGPVSIQSAFSVEPVEITSLQITKSASNEGDGKKKTSDTMGMKHRIKKATYVFFGAISPQLARLTGFSDEDAETLKKILPKLFEGDASSARPEGSMEVKTVLWWKHNCAAGQYSSAKVHRSITVNSDGSYAITTPLRDLTPEEIPGF